MKFWFAVRYKQLIHTFLTEKHPFEQDFQPLSTDIEPGYYYYLYIDKTRFQANYTDEIVLSNFINVMKEFILKKLRANA
jgi:hypothetical protein